MIKPQVSAFFQSWASEVRTQGFDALWSRLGDGERETLNSFAAHFNEVYAMELDLRWQDAVNAYKGLADDVPEFGDIAIARAGFIVRDKINRAIGYYNNGVQSLQAKNFARAAQCFEMALNVHPSMIQALYNLGIAHRSVYVTDPSRAKDNRHHALDAFKKLLRLQPENDKVKAQIEYLRRL